MMSQPKHCPPTTPSKPATAWKARGDRLVTVLGVADDRVAPLGETP